MAVLKLEKQEKNTRAEMRACKNSRAELMIDGKLDGELLWDAAVEPLLEPGRPFSQTRRVAS